jgi:hypothetical protein
VSIVLGVPVPGRVRTAADVPALHRPWSFALGSGLLEISGSVAAAEPALEQWSTSTDIEALDAWWAGFRAVCTAESDTRREGSVITLALAFLEAVAMPDGPESLLHRVVAIVERREEDEDPLGWGYVRTCRPMQLSRCLPTMRAVARTRGRRPGGGSSAGARPTRPGNC